ncbi:MAG: hypothetical protein JXB88_01900 [Spirochaetales bacterium]|nr:hypothetical protein [Spirochaetales bacterium]
MVKKCIFVIALICLLLFTFNSCITVVFPEDGNTNNDNDNNDHNKDKFIKGKFQVHANPLLKDKYELKDKRGIVYRLVGLNDHQEKVLRKKDGKWITARIEILSRPSADTRNARLIRIY